MSDNQIDILIRETHRQLLIARWIRVTWHWSPARQDRGYARLQRVLARLHGPLEMIP